MPILRTILLATALLACATVSAEERTLRFRGYAYDLASKRFLYTEAHEQKIVDERWLGGRIDYYAPDGTRLGHKTMDFTRDPYIPVYRLDLAARGGYMEGIAAVLPDRIELTKQGYGAVAPATATVPHRPPIAADSGFHVFIRDHFAALLDGQVVPFTFVVAGNLGAYKFRARRIGDATFEGQPVVRFRVEPDSLLRWLVDPLELSYETKQRKLLEYHGISNIHDPATGKAYNVRIIYPSAPPADAPALTVTE